ncbi:uncharacterized protein LOC141893178 isoform X2 [Acropora palmata]|uniref:uncharacterized protein LOC141893178 isoform X2 n=1 Tax=Acropora palmata TaxID=6131 RepID=UPI003D9FBA51
MLMVCQFLSDVKLGPSACEVQCRASRQETPSTRALALRFDPGTTFHQGTVEVAFNKCEMSLKLDVGVALRSFCYKVEED